MHIIYFSVQFSSSVVSNSLQLYGLQHARPPCLLPTPGVYSNSCTLRRWCHPTISSSVIPFSCPQSFPASVPFKWVSSLHQVAKVLGFQLQHQSLQGTLMKVNFPFIFSIWDSAQFPCPELQFFCYAWINLFYLKNNWLFCFLGLTSWNCLPYCKTPL